MWGIFGGGGPESQQSSPEDVVETYCDQINTSTLITDRRAAVQGLLKMSKQFQRETGSLGMMPLLKVLREDADDADIVRSALETLLNVCSPRRQQPGAPPDPSDLGSAFTMMLVKDPANVHMLLGLLDNPDVYCRINAMRLLTLLLENDRAHLQTCILEAPQGVSRLIDMLKEGDMVRNEALLLLQPLTSTNGELQKIIAFENAFECLFEIVDEEGGVDGSIIVTDCANIFLNLLRQNVSNQNHFRETGCMRRLANLLNIDPHLVSRASSAAEQDRLENRVGHICELLEVLRAFVPFSRSKAAVAQTGPKSATGVNQQALLAAGVLKRVMTLALTHDIVVKVKAEALFTLGDLIRGCEAAQNEFARSAVPVCAGDHAHGAEGHSHSHSHAHGAHGHSHSASPTATHHDEERQDAVLYVLSMVLDPHSSASLRAAAAYVFKCFVQNRPETQQSLVSSLAAPARSGSVTSTLLTSLINWDAARKDGLPVWFASIILSHMLRGNTAAKEQLLTITYPPGEPNGTPLLSAVRESMLASAEVPTVDKHIQLGYLSLLTTWMTGCPAAVAAYMQDGPAISHLIEHTTRLTGEPSVQGAAALALCTLVLYSSPKDKQGNANRTMLLEIITDRIRTDTLFSRLHDVQALEAFKGANDTLFLPNKEIGLFDVDYVAAFGGIVAEIERTLSAHAQPHAASPAIEELPDPSESESVIDQYKALISQQDGEIQRLKDELKKSKQDLDAARINTEALLVENKRLQTSAAAAPAAPAADTGKLDEVVKELEKLRADYAELKAEQDDLLMLLAENDIKMRGYRQRLRDLNQEVSDEEDDDLEAADGADEVM